jgi:hypothetical protein
VLLTEGPLALIPMTKIDDVLRTRFWTFMRLVYGGIFYGPLELGGRAGFLQTGHTIDVLLDSSW